MICYCNYSVVCRFYEVFWHITVELRNSYLLLFVSNSIFLFGILTQYTINNQCVHNLIPETILQDKFLFQRGGDVAVIDDKVEFRKFFT